MSCPFFKRLAPMKLTKLQIDKAKCQQDKTSIKLFDGGCLYEEVHVASRPIFFKSKFLYSDVKLFFICWVGICGFREILIPRKSKISLDLDS